MTPTEDNKILPETLDFWSSLTKYKKVELVQKYFPVLSKDYGSIRAIYFLSGYKLNYIYCKEHNLALPISDNMYKKKKSTINFDDVEHFYSF